MSTILLPALRKPAHNLYLHSAAGSVTTSTVTPNFGNSTVNNRVKLTDVGLNVGDVVSASAEIINAVSGDLTRLGIQAEDVANIAISSSFSVAANNTSFTRHTINGFTIPANTDELLIFASKPTPSGNNISIRNGMINRGATAATYETPKRGATAPWTTCSLVRDNLQDAQLRNSGVSQITTFPSRRWLAQFQTIIMSGDELREWALAVDQLSDLNNVFRLVPPRYTGPSTGYAGANPAVNGGSQLGTSLICDGVSVSTAIVKAGDYCSFDVTSAGGETNCQLFKIAAAATSDGSGNVTLTFTTPIRQAPADNAIVQIFSPTAQMAFVAPRGGLDLGSLRRAAVQVDAEERIWP